MQQAPATLVGELEGDCPLPAGSHERFSGYGIMGLTFTSGHVLAMRRFVASSIGPSYTSVWHRDPLGNWVFYADVPARHSCGRFYSVSAADQVETEITLSWATPQRLQVAIPAVALEWSVELAQTAATKVLNLAGRALPERAWKNPAILAAMGAAAGPLLGAGRVALQGRVPNGQRFIASPRTLWVVTASEAVLVGEKLGPIGAIRPQAQLADFWIPQRGIFAIGQAAFNPAGRAGAIAAATPSAGPSSAPSSPWPRAVASPVHAAGTRSSPA